MKLTLNTPAGLYALLLISILVFASCSKKGNLVPTKNEEAGKLTVFVASISDVKEDNNSDVAEDNYVSLDASSDINPKFSTKALSLILQKENKALDTNIVSSGKIDAMLSIVQEARSTKMATGASLPKMMQEKASLPGSLRASAMASGINYRLLLYNPDGSLYSSTLFTTGSPGVIDVAQGVAYTWCAYSYNDNGTVPDVADYTNPTIPTAVNRATLWASGQVTSTTNPGQTSAPTQNLAINFTLQTSRLGIVLNGQGMFAGINAGTVSIDASALQVGTLNLKTGVISNSTPAPAGVTPLPVTVRWKVAMLDTAKIAYYYTSSTNQTVKNLQVTVTDFTLQLDDGTTRAFTGLNAPFTFPTVTPNIGTGKLLKIDLVESALNLGGFEESPGKFTGGINIARGNLYYNTAGAAGPAWVFRHYPDNRYKEIKNEFWSRRFPTPDYLTPPSGRFISPCDNVYPKGKWRQPSVSELSPFIFINPSFNKTFVEFTGKGIGAPYPFNNIVHIEYNGYTMGPLDKRYGTEPINSGNIVLLGGNIAFNPANKQFCLAVGNVPFKDAFPGSMTSGNSPGQPYLITSSFDHKTIASTIRCVR